MPQRFSAEFMGIEVTMWLSAELANVDLTVSDGWSLAVYECARDMGWIVSPYKSAAESGALRIKTQIRPFDAPTVELRAHPIYPVLAFIDYADPKDHPDISESYWEPTGYTYVNPPRVAAWWQARGWIVPDAAWLNGTPTADEYASLPRRQAFVLTRLRWSRGDALFFDPS
ncbi:hypothetical protein [Deinococcus sp.]|uniref:hypothetical protein n=1 Tax=Deinococcus sp. TaxID=47478 RepID=UPI00286989C7|nr:hypothetical protein [Deinococcus sp.]